MLKQMIDSIYDQDYHDFEVIIVDDCSNDGTYGMLEPYRSKENFSYFCNEKNMGPGYSRNYGFTAARGDYVIFIDDDDYYVDSSFFTKAIKTFDENRSSNISFVSARSYVENVRTNSRTVQEIGCTGFKNGTDFMLNLSTKYRKPQSTFTTVFKRSILVQAGMKDMAMVNDYAKWHTP